MGALALQAGRPAVAEGLLVQALALRPAAEFQLTRAHALLALRRPEEAEQAARLVLRGRPHSAKIAPGAGSCAERRWAARRGAGGLPAALRLRPGLPDIHNNLGMALRQAGRLGEAERNSARRHWTRRHWSICPAS